MNRIVVHCRDGRIEKGSTGDLRPNNESFHLHHEDGEVSNVRVDDLKAVFFVKDLSGQPGREDRYEDIVPGGGRKVQVTFEDGEVIVGFANACSPQRRGWFMVPADEGSNNLRVYVVNAAVKDLSFLH